MVTLNEDIEDDENYSDEDEPTRPSNIPSNAKWNAFNNKWELGKTNAEGNPIGEQKWWLAPKGYLCCHTFFYGDSGDTMSFTRYHEDGTPSRIGSYVDGQPNGNITWIRSEKTTIEEYPKNANKNVQKTVSTIRDGYTVEEHYFDKEDNEIQEPYIGDEEISELLKRMGVLNRFYVKQNWDKLFSESKELETDNLLEDDQDTIKVVYYKAKALYELNSRQVNEEIEELAQEIRDLKTVEIWDYLEQFKIIKEALNFANTILGDDDESDRETDPSDKYESLKYPHGAISADGSYIAVGSQDSGQICVYFHIRIVFIGSIHDKYKFT